MTIKNSKAKKKYWAELPEDVRSFEMSRRRKLGWANKTKKERRDRAMLMVKARAKKRLSTT